MLQTFFSDYESFTTFVNADNAIIIDVSDVVYNGYTFSTAIFVINLEGDTTLRLYTKENSHSPKIIKKVKWQS